MWQVDRYNRSILPVESMKGELYCGFTMVVRRVQYIGTYQSRWERRRWPKSARMDIVSFGALGDGSPRAGIARKFTCRHCNK